MMETILSILAIWAPSVTAILGVVMVVLAALTRVKDIIDSLRGDEETAKIKSEVKGLCSRLDNLVRDNAELRRVNCELKEALTKVRKHEDNGGDER